MDLNMYLLEGHKHKLRELPEASVTRRWNTCTAFILWIQIALQAPAKHGGYTINSSCWLWGRSYLKQEGQSGISISIPSKSRRGQSNTMQPSWGWRCKCQAQHGLCLCNNHMSNHFEVKSHWSTAHTRQDTVLIQCYIHTSLSIRLLMLSQTLI